MTADHGMNSKNRADGSPNVVYVETLLKQEKLSADGLTVICPITDPYVVHHGALGSLVMVHVDEQAQIPAMIDSLKSVDGVTEVYDRVDACRRLELAEDRIGDICVLCGRDFVLGKAEADHDLSVLKGGLRSHGGRYEEMVPMVLSEPSQPGIPRQGAGRSAQLRHLRLRVQWARWLVAARSKAVVL